MHEDRVSALRTGELKMVFVLFFLVFLDQSCILQSSADKSAFSNKLHKALTRGLTTVRLRENFFAAVICVVTPHLREALRDRQVTTAQKTRLSSERKWK